MPAKVKHFQIKPNETKSKALRAASVKGLKKLRIQILYKKNSKSSVVALFPVHSSLTVLRLTPIAWPSCAWVIPNQSGMSEIPTGQETCLKMVKKTRQKRIHDHLGKMPVLAFPPNADLSQWFTGARVAEKHDWPGHIPSQLIASILFYLSQYEDVLIKKYDMKIEPHILGFVFENLFTLQQNILYDDYYSTFA